MSKIEGKVIRRIGDFELVKINGVDFPYRLVKDDKVVAWMTPEFFDNFLTQTTSEFEKRKRELLWGINLNQIG